MSDPLPISEVGGIVWPAIAPAPAATMLAMQWQLEDAHWWPADKLLEQQMRQLRMLVGHAVAHVPYYRDLLADAGLGSASEIDAESFRRLALLPKSKVRSNEAGLTASWMPSHHRRTIYTYTTGSTGEPTRVAHTDVSQFFSDALGIHDHLLHGRDLSQKYGVIKSSVKRGSQPGWGVVNALFSTGPAVQQSSSLDMDAQLDWLLEERPAYLQSYCSNLLALVKRSAETGKVPAGIRQLLGYGDMPPPELPLLARSVWGAEFVATYSCMELGLVASQCPGHHHYLVHAPAFYVEVLRNDGEPCAAGETGRLVITALHNFAMPLIRYEIGDYAEVGGPCPTGRGLPTLARIAGRYRNMLRHPDGRLTWPSFPGEMWVKLSPVRKVRLVQTEPARIEVQYEMDRELTAHEQSALRGGLTEKLGRHFDFAFSREASLQRAPGEKWEDFVSLLP